MYVAVANEVVLGIRGTYLHDKQPLRTLGFDSRLLGCENMPSDTIKVGWEYIECVLKQHHRNMKESYLEDRHSKMRNC